MLDAYGCEENQLSNMLHINSFLNELSYINSFRMRPFKELNESKLNEEVPGGRYWEPGWEDANDYADAIISDYYDYGEFLDWCERQYGPGFNPMDLSDEEYYELEDAFKADNNLKNESLKSLIEAIHPNIDRVQGAYEEAVNQGLKKQAEEILADTLIKVKKGKCIETSANSNTANAYYRLYR